jgi:hypothetical protein
VVPEDALDPSVRSQLPPAKLGQIGAQIFGQLGSCAVGKVLESQGGLSAKYQFVCAKGMSFPLTLVVAPRAPHGITGIWFGPPVAEASSPEELAASFRKLPGSVSVSLRKLGEQEAAFELDPDKQLAIGSAFKLYVLATLDQSVRKGERRWSDVVELDAAARSLPSGTLHTWPVGTPLTLYSLATSMISVSDNTATDQLLRLLGRDAVEATVRRLGHGDPARNVPFLATSEMFRLKSVDGPAEEYLKQPPEARRAFLDQRVATLPLSAVKFPSEPSHIDSIEWFASARDLGAVWQALKEASDADPAGAGLRGIVSVNPGTGTASMFQYVGFKGGSEPGVLVLSFLLQTKGGDWYTLAAVWNDPAAPLDDARFFSLVERMLVQLSSR